MPFDEGLAARVRKLMARRKGVEEKKMFGGLGFLLAGNMCCCVWKEYLILRLGTDEAEAALREPHARAFDVTGRPMKGWVMMGQAGVVADAALADWVGRAVAFTRSLPAK